MIYEFSPIFIMGTKRYFNVGFKIKLSKQHTLAYVHERFYTKRTGSTKLSLNYKTVN